MGGDKISEWKLTPHDSLSIIEMLVYSVDSV